MTHGTTNPAPEDPRQGMSPEERRALRRRDAWAAPVLMAVSLFFLWRTSRLPFFEASAAGVEAEWYNSAALVPYGVFGALLLLSTGLLAIALREGGAGRGGGVKAGAGREAGGAGEARGAIGTGGAGRVMAIATILFFYIFGLVPRVDFVIASALAITALIYGFHEGRRIAILASTGAVAVAGLFAMLAYGPQSAWGAHADDTLALACWLALSAFAVVETRQRRGRWAPTVTAAPLVGAVVPLLLVCTMAFGFRQNVPARTGLVFGALEYHYYVTLRPWLAGG